MKSPSPLHWCAIALLLAVVVEPAFAQPRRRGGRGGGRFVEMERRALAEPFMGVTADGKVEKGLFELAQTGVSTEPVAKAARAFLAGLTDAQRKKTAFPVDDNEWRKWANQHSYPRQGMGFNEMTPKQRELAFGLVGAGLSARGLKLTQDIMKLNGTLGELTGRHDEYTEWLYWITIMGEPSTTRPWGWQLDGHHVVINYFVLGDQVVMTPLFVGSEPVEATSGRFKGTIILQTEQAKGLEMINSLKPAQQAKAILQKEKPGNNGSLEAFRDNMVIPYAGLKASEMDPDQRGILLELIGLYVGATRADQAKVRMSEVQKHLDDTYFAWVGGTDPDSVFFFRIHSPVIIIEFDHQRGIALNRGGPPNRDHIHSVVRTPNGNDYGKELLRLHLEREHGR
jgi:hypothetical protein